MAVTGAWRGLATAGSSREGATASFTASSSWQRQVSATRKLVVRITLSSCAYTNVTGVASGSSSRYASSSSSSRLRETSNRRAHILATERRPSLASSDAQTAAPARRHVSDYVRVNTAEGRSARITLRDGKNGVYGVAHSRGNRAYQEDTYSVACVHVDPAELRHSLQTSRSRVLQEAGKRWDPVYHGEDDAVAGQVAWFGVFDGHGGQAVSSFLKDELHSAFESVTPDMVTDTAIFTRKLGGYFRRFAGGALERWVRQDRLPQIRAGRPGSTRHRPSKETSDSSSEGGSNVPLSTEELDRKAKEMRKSRKEAEEAVEQSDNPTGVIEVEKIGPPDEVKDDTMTIGERATLAWLHVDRRIQSSKVLNVGGSTASVALLHSLDSPAKEWYSSEILSVTSVQIGDTRMLLCSASDGHAIPLTNYHHPDERSEAERLRRVGAGIVTDSFGEARWMGALANTRAFGDTQFKKAGVTAEPEVITQVLRGDDFSFIIAFSDGVGGVVSDQEAVDLCRDAKHPHDAAQNVVRYAEALGSEDNATCLVIPLRGWGKTKGNDQTAEKRKFKLSKVDIFRDHRQ